MLRQLFALIEVPFLDELYLQLRQGAWLFDVPLLLLVPLPLLHSRTSDENLACGDHVESILEAPRWPWPLALVLRIQDIGPNFLQYFFLQRLASVAGPATDNL